MFLAKRAEFRQFPSAAERASNDLIEPYPILMCLKKIAERRAGYQLICPMTGQIDLHGRLMIS